VEQPETNGQTFRQTTAASKYEPYSTVDHLQGQRSNRYEKFKKKNKIKSVTRLELLLSLSRSLSIPVI
jgi:hypothetical protein